ncbi:helix-turn-helix transcriptional regulator [Streptomyces sp. NPDC000410]|uniref:helix-turn-helix transcriptional regulator n=1 Tax=Streptomyces sp. NPDC000410 TaxID=3154254 RepID=UPI0033304CEC
MTLLEPLGVDAVSERVYRTMLEHPGEGLVAIRDRLSLSHVDLHRALGRLQAHALVRPTDEPARELHAVSPDLGMQILLSRQQQKLAAHQERLEASRAAAARLLSELEDQGRAPVIPTVRHLHGLDRIRDQVEKLNTEVVEDLMAICPGGSGSLVSMRALAPLPERLLAGGVRIRILYRDSVGLDPDALAVAQWLAEIGCQVRTVPELSTQVLIYDRRLAITAVDRHDTGAGAVLTDAPGMVAALGELFDSRWETATPLGAAHQNAEDRLTRQQAAALRLLAQGHTDESVGKRLGVSTRTARRIATEIMGLLRARSRFQAGVYAAQVGLLSSPTG